MHSGSDLLKLDEMVIKWLFKAILGAILAIVILMFPHKVADISVALAGAVWDVAITIGRSLNVPGVTEKTAVILPWIGLMFPPLKNLLEPLNLNPKEINYVN